MSYEVSLTNTSDSERVFEPTASNLDNFAACKLTIPAGATASCNGRMTHVLSADDVANGGFTPSITYAVKASDGSVLSTLPASNGQKIDIDIDSYVDATITITNPKEVWNVGDRINYDIAFRQNTGTIRAVYPVESNLMNYEACRSVNSTDAWMACNGRAYHVVTQEDLDNGGFVPFVKYVVYQTRDYKGPQTPTPPNEGTPSTVKPVVVNFEEFTSTSEAKDEYRVGDELTFSLNYKAVDTSGTRSVTFLPGNGGFSATELEQCNGELTDGQSKQCTLKHVVTAEDLDGGSFTPQLLAEVRVGNELYQQASFSGAQVALPAAWGGAEPGTYANVDPTLAAERGEDVQLSSAANGNFYRIPSLIKAANGDLLASYDLRPGSAADAPNPNWIVQRRSTDNGATWGPQTIIAQGKSGNGKIGYSDPSYLVDYETGKIFNFHVKSYDQGFWGGVLSLTNGSIDPNNRQVLHLHVAESTDNGHTWTGRVITDMALRDHVGRLKSGFATSGNGLQIQHGKYKGRLVQPYAFQLTQAAGSSVNAVALYSDDHGETWKLGNIARVAAGVNRNFDENKIVELSDGTLMLNSRSPGGYRLVATSTDGGITWSPATLETQLPDPVNNATIIRAFPTATEGTAKSKVLLFSNTASQGRTNGTLSVSCDSGKTWPNENKRIFRPEYTGYTSIAVQNDGRIGVLYETPGSGIGYTDFTLNWVREGICDIPTSVTLADIADTTVTVDTELTAIPVNVSGGEAAADRQVTVTGLPAGLSFDKETLTITGTPTEVTSALVTVSVKDDDGTESSPTATDTFTLTVEAQPTLTGPTTATAGGGSARVAATGFAPGESVTLSTDGPLSAEPVVADETGTAIFTVRVNEDAEEGTYTLTATGATSGKTATLDFAATAKPAPVEVEGSAQTVRTSDEVTITAKGFAPREAVNLIHSAPVSLKSVNIPTFRSFARFAVSALAQQGFTATADAEGTAVFHLLINEDATPGDYELTARGATSDRSATYTLTVLPADEPTPGETDEPTPGETDEPTPGETDEPTPGETDEPTPGETDEPTPGETDQPTPGETDQPTPGETDQPTDTVTSDPTADNGSGSDVTKKPAKVKSSGKLAFTGASVATLASVVLVLTAGGVIVLRRRREA
ncbi:exo-alpha-sialidase [Arcanobacterium haemolyticum]|nr:exo-alpha-sialidase [Arcanobacterium haemolyticum]